MLKTVASRIVLVGRVATPLVALAIMLAWVVGLTAIPSQGAIKPVRTAYAHVNATTGTFDPARSKGVVEVRKGGQPNEYCFDLTFKPKVAVGSPFINNNAVVGVWTPPDGVVGFSCPTREDGLPWDAAAQVHASQSPEDVSFKIVFH